MKLCWHCGTRFGGVLSDGRKAAHCDECQQIPVCDGSTEGYRLSYLFSELMNREWTEEEYETFANSALGGGVDGLIENALRNMDLDCAVKLMHKVLKERT